MREAARRASALLLSCYGQLRRSQIEAKSLNDFVTVVDTKSQQRILRILSRSYPAYGIRAEEGKICRERKRMWVIDPLDGTSNYIHQFPLFCISIALTELGRPILGLVLDPVHDECFTAVKGRGSYLNGRRITVSKTRRLADAFVATGFPYRIRKYFEPYNRSLRQFFHKTAAIRRGGSAALDLCYTACGRVDGFWEFGLSEWDIAAGSLLVEEAGGLISDFKGRKRHLVSGSVVAGNPAVQRSLVAVLKRIRGFRDALPAEA